MRRDFRFKVEQGKALRHTEYGPRDRYIFTMDTARTIPDPFAEPGANPKRLMFQFSVADEYEVDKDGKLVLSTSVRTVTPAGLDDKRKLMIGTIYSSDPLCPDTTAYFQDGDLNIKAHLNNDSVSNVMVEQGDVDVLPTKKNRWAGLYGDNPEHLKHQRHIQAVVNAVQTGPLGELRDALDEQMASCNLEAHEATKGKGLRFQTHSGLGFAYDGRIQSSNRQQR